MTTNVNLGFVADAGGTVNAITAFYTPTYTVLVDKMLVWFRATGANTSTTPTFSPNGLTARTIVKQGGQPLAAGDIPGAGAVMEMVYDATNTRWELLNVGHTPAFMKWIKVTKTYADFSAASTTNDIEIYSLPAKGMIHKVITKHSQSFTGGSINAYTLSVGLAGLPNEYNNAFDVFQAPSNTAFFFTTGTMDVFLPSFGSATSIRAFAESTADDLDAATQGSVDFYILISTLP